MASADAEKAIPAAAKAVIHRLGLAPHPEGGYYKRIYESEATISPDLDRTTYAEGERHVMTHIYFLLTAGNVSRLHRIASDELWHFYAGDPLTVVEASKDSTSVKTTTIGSDPSKYDPCYVVPGGTWFGSRPEGEWSLVGCSVAPGFDFREFELATREEAENELGDLAGHPDIASLLPSVAAAAD